MAEHTVTLDDKFEAALAQDALDSSVDSEQFLLDTIKSRLTDTCNRLVQNDKDARLAAFDSALDTDTKADIVEAAKTPKVG